MGNNLTNTVLLHDYKLNEEEIEKEILEKEEERRREPRKRKYIKKLEAFVHSQDLRATKVLNPLYDWEKKKRQTKQQQQQQYQHKLPFEETTADKLNPKNYHVHVTLEELQAIMEYRTEQQQQQQQKRRGQFIGKQKHFLRKGEGSLASTTRVRKEPPKKSLFMLAEDPYQEPPSRFKRTSPTTNTTTNTEPFKTTFKPKPTFPAVDATLPSYMHSNEYYDGTTQPDDNLKRQLTEGTDRQAFLTPTKPTMINNLMEKHYPLGAYAS
mmetsp:Transcript_11327/g.16779  ORF Transcript_11327/g.16779 Transcript_11327/m.16779 type:complete len:267 (+) Transcript_11327:35-835(+)